MMNLPKAFEIQMKDMLGDELEAFLESYDQEKRSGLRVNTLKISVEDFLKISPFELEPIPWTNDGFYFLNEERPAKHPYYHCGLYYIQEPSAMAPVAAMDIDKNQLVLDLCAAPGGKTVQIAAKLKDTGCVVTNDISTGRVKALVKNIELFGIKNAYVLNESQEKIGPKFYQTFDRVLIDAPCSGEGMFRKDAGAVDAWESHGIKRCSEIQHSIVDHIMETLKPGGELMYSTCTFNKVENELLIDYILEKNSDMTCIEIDPMFGFSNGFAVNANEALRKTKRLFPHRHDGEGHFLGKLKRDGEASKLQLVKANKAPEAYLTFEKENLSCKLQGRFELIKDKLYLLPDLELDTSGLRVARSGWLLGEIKRDRFKPAQSLAMGLKKEDVKRVISISVEDDNAIKYLKGETISVEGEKGLNLITIDGYPVGWGRLQGRNLKNDYPPAWRYL